ncbi:hypothetical protein DFJ73DRAFT_346579 [Zopfochytrium polystomum]|nr:hypothetical protein DFJ73DRAFT_346579 [Zopfochytrium polystomum]
MISISVHHNGSDDHNQDLNNDSHDSVADNDNRADPITTTTTSVSTKTVPITVNTTSTTTSASTSTATVPTTVASTATTSTTPPSSSKKRSPEMVEPATEKTPLLGANNAALPPTNDRNVAWMMIVASMASGTCTGYIIDARSIGSEVGGFLYTMLVLVLAFRHQSMWLPLCVALTFHTVMIYLAFLRSVEPL